MADLIVGAHGEEKKLFKSPLIKQLLREINTKYSEDIEPRSAEWGIALDKSFKTYGCLTQKQLDVLFGITKGLKIKQGVVEKINNDYYVRKKKVLK